MTVTIAILGATGRTGRGIARALHDERRTLLLVGRDEARLADLAAELPGSRIVAAPFEAALETIKDEDITVVVNTVGPFERTAPQVIDALRSAHYVDLGNDPIAVGAVLDRGATASAEGRTLVTGAGFGVIATQSAAIRAIEGRVAPASLRVDAMASVASDGDAIGEALAATIVDGIGSMARIPVRRRRDWPKFGSGRQLIVTPEGREILSVGFPSGEFIAAARATGAASVFSASSEAPTSRIVPLVLPLALVLLRSARLRRALIRRLARLPWSSEAEARPSWARAQAMWSDGDEREAWFRAGDGMEFTIASAAEVVVRLLRGDVRAGAYTPGELFGTEIAIAAGATLS